MKHSEKEVWGILSWTLYKNVRVVSIPNGTNQKPFTTWQENAIELAETLVSIGERFGKKTIAYITNMNQPTGKAVGNWLEVKETIECLKGDGPKDTNFLSHLLFC